MSTTGVFLDDIRDIDQIPPYINTWVTVRNYKEFTEFIEKYWETNNKLPEVITFDHDLAVEHDLDRAGKAPDAPIFYMKFKEKTGKECAEWLVAFAKSKDIDLGRIAIHSMNPVGAYRIENIINDYKKERGNYTDSPCFRINWKYK